METCRTQEETECFLHLLKKHDLDNITYVVEKVMLMLIYVPSCGLNQYESNLTFLEKKNRCLSGHYIIQFNHIKMLLEQIFLTETSKRCFRT